MDIKKRRVWDDGGEKAKTFFFPLVNGLFEERKKIGEIKEDRSKDAVRKG